MEWKVSGFKYGQGLERGVSFFFFFNCRNLYLPKVKNNLRAIGLKCRKEEYWFIILLNMNLNAVICA